VIVLFLSLWACQPDSPAERQLNAPVAAAILPGESSPFGRPMGLLSNSRGGTVVPVDPSRGWLLSADAAAPFLADPGLAFGARRVLGDLATWSPDGEVVWVVVADTRSGTLLSTTWIEGVDEKGEPIQVVPVHDAEIEAPDLLDVSLRAGRTTTETWTLSWDDGGWEVEGSVSGKQGNRALPKVAYTADQMEVRFTAPVGAEGDVISFSTETGVLSHDLGGTIQSLVGIPETGFVAATVLDLATGLGQIVLWDMLLDEVVSTLDLGDSSVPLRLALAEGGEVLYVTDAALPVVYEVLLESAPSLELLRTLDMPGPVSELAWAKGEGFDRLFVAVEGEGAVHILELDTETWFDANPWTDAVDGVKTGSPIQGLAATGRVVETPQETSFGGVLRDEVIAIATLAGEMWFLAARSGCLVETAAGPTSFLDPDRPFVDAGAPSNPVMESTGFANRPVQFNTCAGVVRDEQWVATFDENRGAWEVVGSLSGVQSQFALEDERFVTDRGTLSFLIRSGSAPSSAGDRFQWRTVSGVAGVTGIDRDGNGELDLALRHPGRPVSFEGDLTVEDSPWAGPTSAMLWPITSGDLGVVVDVSRAAPVSILD
jgi:hypothetical protein